VGLTLVTPPTEYPVSLDLARQHVRVTGTSRDELLTLYLGAATGRVERFLGRSLIDQTWDYHLDAFPTDGSAIDIPMPPLIEIVGLFYSDGSGGETEVDSADYVQGVAMDGAGLIVPTSGSWPTAPTEPSAVRLRFRAGYLDQTVSPAEPNVPDAIKVGILLYTGDIYAHRETFVIEDTAVELPNYIDGMLRPYRVRLGMA